MNFKMTSVPDLTLFLWNNINNNDSCKVNHISFGDVESAKDCSDTDSSDDDIIDEGDSTSLIDTNIRNYNSSKYSQ
jgi:hypothetical protein